MSNDPTETQLDAQQHGAPPQAPSSEEVSQVNSTEQAPATDAPETEESAHVTRRPILIGSQRDAANVRLRPSTPKAVREAKHATPTNESPEDVDRDDDTPTALADSSESDEQMAVEQPVAEQPTQPETVTEPEAPAIDEKIEIPETANDLDEEIEAALSDVSIDELVEKHETEAASEVLEENSRHKGTVMKLHRDNVFFSLRGRHQGVASVKQFKKPPKTGSQMDVVVSGFNAEDGLYELHIPGASVDVADWDDLQTGTVVEARVTGANTGGLECLVNNIRGFIPASQIALYHVDNLSEYINQKLSCVVTEANRRRRNLVLSHRAVLEREQEEHRKQFLDQLQVGEVREGTVRKLHDFGAFVELAPGVDGLAHISKLSWDHVQHPSEVFEVGQTTRVKIEKIDKQTGKIGLTIRDLMDHPWSHVEEKYHANTIVQGTVSRIAKFGAFVKLEPGVEGLIHISELAHQHVPSVSSVVEEGQEIEAQVLSVDAEAQRIALSLKATQPEAKYEAAESDDTEAAAKPIVPRRKKQLKGGMDRKSGGEKFGLNW